MKRMLFTLGLAACLLLTGCAGSDVEEPAAGFYRNGVKIELPYVLKINGADLSLEEYRYFFLNMKKVYDDDQENIDWSDADNNNALREQTLLSIKEHYAYRQLADDYGVTLDLATQTQLNDSIETLLTQNREKLAEGFMTEALYRTLMNDNAKKQQLQTLWFGEGGEFDCTDAAMKARVYNEYLRATQIFIPHATADARARIDQAYARLQNGEDFVALAKEYGEDEYIKDIENVGYYFTTGQKPAVFEETARSLETGAHSAVVESDYGFHIILRLPIDEVYVTANLTSLETAYRSTVINRQVSAQIERMQIEYCEQYEEITAKTLI